MISSLADKIHFIITQPAASETLSFPGLEIRQSRRQVFQDGEEINLTRLEYGTLIFLASNPGIVFTQTQIFEAVWNINSDSCQSSVVNVIYTLRKKIEPDSKNPTYIKTVLGVGYKFNE
ncbi:MAG: response regulator transcription factor [Lachnospiraceae bacterium]|nr:response regulator transcription factor [Lachnospiraceae bacterium]